MGLREKIQQTLSTKEETSRKTVSINLESELLESVDRIAKEFSKISERNFSRNFIIEEAIKEYVSEAASVLLDLHKVDIGESLEEDEGGSASIEFDLVIYPAHNDGFEETFIGEDCWYSVRIKEDKIPKVKYVAVYRSAPVSGITHYAKVKEISQYMDTNKKIIYFDGPAVQLNNTVQLGATDPNAMRSPRYTTLSKLKNATTVKDLF